MESPGNDGGAQGRVSRAGPALMGAETLRRGWRRRPGRRWTAVAGLVGAAIGLAWPSSALAAPGTDAAEGDAYAVQAQAFVLGQALTKTPIQVGPVAPAYAVTPPGVSNLSQSGVVTFSSGGQQPVVDYVNVVNDTAKANIQGASAAQQATTECAIPPQALTPGFVAGPLTGGNACVAIAQVGVLNAGSAQAPADVLVAAAVEAQSLTENCVDPPKGFVNIARLSVAGNDIIGGTSPLLGTNTPAPNTQIDIPPLLHLILNEQHYDNQGHGLTVNAIHVFTDETIAGLAQADIVIGHAHSEATCVSGTTNTGSLPNPGNLPVPIVTKGDSTKSANPGEQVTYTISIDNQGCIITRVTDILPPGFSLVSASGPLGDPVVSTYPGTQQQALNWFAPSGFPQTPNPLVETLVVQISPNEAPGLYVNNVAGQSSPAVGASGCGAFQGIDFLPVTTAPPGSPPGTTGTNPGIIVPRPGPAPSTPLSGVQAATAPPITGTPNTAAATGTALPAALALVGIAGLAGALRRRRLR